LIAAAAFSMCLRRFEMRVTKARCSDAAGALPQVPRGRTAQVLAFRGMELAAKRYSTAFCERPIRAWREHSPARSSVVLARLLAEDAVAAEVRNDYEAAYERYFASADALFRAVQVLEACPDDQVLTSHDPVGERAHGNDFQKETPERARGSSPLPSETLRTLCYRQIEALIARCEAIREYLYASAMANEDASDSSLDENFLHIGYSSGEKLRSEKPRCTGSDSGDREQVGSALRQRLEACRAMQEALEQSRSAAWLMDATLLVQRNHTSARIPLQKIPERAVPSEAAPKRNLAAGKFDERWNLVPGSDPVHISSPGDEARTPSPAQRRLARGLAWMQSPSTPSESDASSATAAVPAATASAHSSFVSRTPQILATTTVETPRQRTEPERLIARSPSDARHESYATESNLSHGTQMTASYRSRAVKPTLVDERPPTVPSPSASSAQAIHRQATKPEQDVRQSTRGHAAARAPAASAASDDAVRGNRSSASPSEASEIRWPQRLEFVSSGERSLTPEKPRTRTDDAHVAANSLDSDMRSFRTAPDERNPDTPAERTLDVAASGCSGIVPDPSAGDEDILVHTQAAAAAAAAAEARLVIQQELARRFQEIRQQQREHAHPAHPEQQQREQRDRATDQQLDVRDTSTVAAAAAAAAAAPSIRTDPSVFETTCSSEWCSNQSSISRSRYEAMKTRVALMKERLGKMMLAGTCSTTIVMSAAPAEDATRFPRHEAPPKTTAAAMQTRHTASSPSSLGAASNALQLSHAIVNLHAGTFGEFKRLEPLPAQAATRWSMEIDFLLSPCEQIVVRTPVRRTLPDGTSVEVLESRLRADIGEHLPRLRSLDHAIREMLRSFRELSGVLHYESTATRGPDWWIERPRVPTEGLSPGIRALLQRSFAEAQDIQRVARSINEQVLRSIPCPTREYSCSCFGYDLSELTSAWSLTPRRRPLIRVREVLGPDLYEAVTKNAAFSAVAYARTAVLRLSSDAVLPLGVDADAQNAKLTQLVERLERAEFVYRLKIDRLNQASRFGIPWRREKLERCYAARRRCERGAHALREIFTGVGHTTRDQCAIRYNTDVGTAILEAYARVLEHRAAAIGKRIRLVLEADQRQQQQLQQQQHQRLRSGRAGVSLRASGSRLELSSTQRADACSSSSSSSGSSSGSSSSGYPASDLPPPPALVERPRTMPAGLFARQHRSSACRSHHCHADELTTEASVSQGMRCGAAVSANKASRTDPLAAVRDSGAETLPVRRTTALALWTNAHPPAPEQAIDTSPACGRSVVSKQRTSPETASEHERPA